MRIGVVIGGASGVRYAIRLLHVLRDKGIKTLVVYTKAASLVAMHEESISDLGSELRQIADEVYHEDDIDAPPASSSNAPDSTVVVPCSVTLLAKIANGVGDSLASRLALNTLRLARKLVIVLRETPLSPIDLENALKLARIGAVILPAAPAFYHKPRSIDDMVDFIVGKILDVLGIEHSLYRRWRSS